MDGAPSTLPGMPHDPAGRLAAHAAALQPAPVHRHAELSQQSRASPVPDVSNWATDFTRFSGQQQMRQPPTAHAAPLAVAQMNQLGTQPNFQAAFGQAFGPAMYGGPQFMNPGMAGPVGVEADFDKEMSQWMSSHGAGNMSEVDAAMDQMARELELNEAALPVEVQEQATSSADRYTDLETPEIGNLSLQERGLDFQEPAVAPASEQEQVIHDEAAAKGKSAVSEAAERLLESVQHEDGEKWQNSVFLSLMRDFRDGRKDIVDNEIRALEGEGGEEHQPHGIEEPSVAGGTT